VDASNWLLYIIRSPVAVLNVTNEHAKHSEATFIDINLHSDFYIENVNEILQSITKVDSMIVKLRLLHAHKNLEVKWSKPHSSQINVKLQVD